MTNNVKFVLVKKASGANYSVEAGLHDGERNWDHHPGSYEGEQPPSPCNNPEIGRHALGRRGDWGDKVATIEVTHLDADTLCGIWRLKGDTPGSTGRYDSPFNYDREYHPRGDHDDFWEEELDLNLMERIDLNGSSSCSDKEYSSATHAFMVGVGAIAREIGFPRLASGQEELDVTYWMDILLNEKDTDDFIAAGRKDMEQEEKSYRECKKLSGDLNSSSRNSTQEETLKGLWVVGAEDSFDPSRPYRDGCDIVVVYRTHYKSISIYVNPKAVYIFGGETVGGIAFAGHPKACGSPRGAEMTLEDAIKVFEDI